MPFTIRRKSLFSRVKDVDLGCGSCMKPKISHIFHPKPKLKTPLNRRSTYNNHHDHRNNSTSSLWSKCDDDDDTNHYASFYKQQQEQEDYSHYTTTTTTTTFSSNTFTSDAEFDRRSPRMVDDQFGRVGGPSLAMEKESNDPYLDFRHSMLQMILEKEIYSKDELRELLNCFLQLNSPYHHGIIIRAFTEIWNGVFSVKQTSTAAAAAAATSSRRQRRYRPRDF